VRPNCVLRSRGDLDSDRCPRRHYRDPEILAPELAGMPLIIAAAFSGHGQIQATATASRLLRDAESVRISRLAQAQAPCSLRSARS
jgi:hypothetical protein